MDAEQLDEWQRKYRISDEAREALNKILYVELRETFLIVRAGIIEMLDEMDEELKEETEE